MELLPESLLSLSPFFPFRTKMPFSRSMPKSCPLKSGSPISLITAIQMRRHIKACWLKNRGQKGAAELNRSSSWILLYPAPSCQWSKTFFDRALDGRARNAEFWVQKLERWCCAGVLPQRGANSKIEIDFEEALNCYLFSKRDEVQFCKWAPLLIATKVR